MSSAYYYAPTGGAPQLINLSQAAKLEAQGWIPVSGKFISNQKKEKIVKPKAEKVTKTKTTKTNPTSTTKKTVTKTTNKKGETVIKVNKTITLKNKK